MANEFVARNGLISQNNVIVSGSVSITGSSGTLFTSNTDTLEITGSLIVTGSATFTGSVNFPSGLTGSLLGTSSYATNANLLDGLDSTVFTSTASFAAQTASFTAFSASINSFSSSILSYTSSANTRFGNIEAATSSLFNFSSSHNSATSSLFSYTSSTDAKIASIYTTTASLNASVTGLNAQSASLLSYTSSTDAKIASIYSTTSSLNASVASLNSYTSSTDAKIASIYTTTSSLNTAVGSLNNATASLNNFSSSHNTATASLNAAVSSLNSATSSIQTFTSSASTRLSALEAATASLYTATSSFSGRVGALESATSSLYNFSSSHNNATSSLYSFTSSLNARSSSFATTGSNTFVGNQTITGSLNISGSINSSGTITAQTLVVQVITSSQNFITGSTKFGTLTSNTHQFTGSIYQSGSEAIFAGNVGIGTNAPGTLLDVQGTATDTYVQIRSKDTSISEDGEGTRIRFSTSDTTYLGHIGYYKENSSLIGMNLKSTNHIYFNSNSTGVTMMYLSSSGFVGIGTLSPGSEGPTKLYVNGTQAIEGARDLNWGGFTSQLLIRNSAGAATDVGAAIGFGSSNYGAGGIVNAFENTSTVPATYMAFHTRLQDGTINEKVRISSVGNVGIGTTSPTSILHVRSSDGTVRFASSTGNDAGRIVLMEAAIDAWSIDGGQANGTFLIRDEYNSSTRLAINNSGNVGIGTTNPGYKLHVAGDAYINGIISASGNFYMNNGDLYGPNALYFNDPGAGEGINWQSGNGWSIFESPYDLANTAGNLQFYGGWNGSSGTRIFTLDSSSNANFTGNVGIGTTGPNARLDILGSADTADVIIIRKSSTGSQRGGFGTTSGIGYLDLYNDSTAKTIRLLADGNSYINGGNVGIGTTDPTATLHLRAASPYIYLDDTSTAGTLKRFKFVAGDVGSTQTMTFGFETTGSTNSISVMSLSEIGNVGIGTLSPSQLLHLKTELAATSSAGSAIQIESGGAGGDQGWIGVNKGTGNGLEFSVENRDIIFNTGATTPFGGTERMRIATGGNVGIGTASPSYRLDVQGGNARFVAAASADALFRIIAANYETEYKSRLFLGENDTLGMTLEYDGVSNIGYIGMNDSVDPTGAYSKRIQMSRAGTEVTFPAGSVGIGTTSPTDKLEVRGVDNGITISSLSANRPVLQLINGSTMMLKLSANGTYGAIADTTGDLMIFKGGSVGIGSTSPVYKLDVSGAGRFTGTLNADSNITFSGYIKPSSNVGYGVKSSDGTVLQEWYNGSIYNYGLVLVSGTHFRTSGAYTGNQYYNASAATNEKAWMIQPGGDHKNFLIGTMDDSFTGMVQQAINILRSGTSISNVSFPNGNVGIGTSSPSVKLQVVGANSAEGQLYVGNTDVTYSAGINFTTSGTNRGFVGWRHTNSGAPFSLTGVHLFNTDNTNIVFGTNNTVKAVINVDGNLGIGTTSPAQKLDVIGKIRATDDLIMAQANPVIEYDGGSTGALRFYSNSTTSERMRITSDGNVGIGTTSPGSFRLDIWQNTSDIARARIKNTNATGSVSLILNTEGSGAGSIGDATIFFDMNSTAWVAGVDKSDSSKFKIANDPYGDFRGGVYFTINTSGNVGIGTDVPYTKLSVMDSNSSTTTMSSGLTIHNPQGIEGIFAGIRFGTYGDNSGGLYPKQFIGGRRDSQGAGHGDIVFANRDAADTSVVSASDIVMIINPVGNVGINSTAPGYKLDVNGTIRATADIIAYSDARVKENVNTITDALTKVTSLRGVSYTRKDTDDKSEKVGVIAQEVLEVLPQVVQQDAEGNYSVAYGNIVGVLIEAIKELKAEIDILKQK